MSLAQDLLPTIKQLNAKRGGLGNVRADVRTLLVEMGASDLLFPPYEESHVEVLIEEIETALQESLRGLRTIGNLIGVG